MQGSMEVFQSKPLGVIMVLKLPISGFLQNSKLPTPKLHDCSSQKASVNTSR